MFYVGLDLGQAADYTALTIVERVVKRKDARAADGTTVFETLYHVRYVQRFQTGTSYPEIVRMTKAITLAEPLNKNCRVIPDATGVGRPVVDVMAEANILHTPVVITGGDKEIFDDDTGYWKVPKRILISNLQVLYGNKQLKFADGLPEQKTLVDELTNFKIKVSSKGNDTYEAWRENEHDDLVLSLALACWYAVRFGGTNQVKRKTTAPPLRGIGVL